MVVVQIQWERVARRFPGSQKRHIGVHCFRGGHIMATTATAAFSSRSDRGEGGWGKGTGEGDFFMACSVDDGDAGFKPASHTLLIQNEEVFSANCSCS
jgi:hypothetical protein